MPIVFDDQKSSPKQKIVFDDEKAPFLNRLSARYASMMGPEGAYGANPAGKLMSMVQKPFNKAGEYIAEQFGKRQFPIAGAALGTAVQMAPDIALSSTPSGEGSYQPGKFGKGILNQLESASGGMKGSLTEQFNRPTTMFAEGTGSAKPLYQNAMKDLPYEQTLFKGLTPHGEIVDKAVDTIEKGGKLEPQEALIARKSLDKVKKKIGEDAFNYYRTTLDKIAKSNVDLAAADPLHRRGMMAESLRQLLPQNKYGGTSSFKTVLAAAGGPMGLLLSPAAQGAGVGAAGLVAKTDPRIITALIQMMRERRQNENPNP